jgi:predicted Kef-type K+ transport protein
LILNSLHLAQGNISPLLDTLSDLGVMLLLFTIGLKIKFKSILKPEIWVTASINIVMSVIIIGGFVLMLSVFGLQTISGLSFASCMLIGFALSFSSTVFVVKILEERGELTSFHGRIAIGILVIQDVFAVVFMTAASDLKPGWSILLLPLYLFIARYVLKYILKHSGHGELLTIFGFFATFIAGALVFYLFGIKPDLGALVIGMLLVSHKKADELYDRMMSYKDFFLVAFFIDVGLTGSITINTLIITALLILFMFVKGVIFMMSMSRFKMRARTAFLAALSLSNYSEFALITGMVGYTAGWITNDWIIAFALLMSTSFLISSPLNSMAHRIFDMYRPLIMRLNPGKKYIDEEPKSIGDAEYMVIGYGSIGRPAYHYLAENMGLKAIAIDYNHEIVKKYKNNEVNINWGDTTNSIFWENIDLSNVKVVLLAMSDFQSNVNTLKEVIKLTDRKFKIGAFCTFVDEAKKLKDLKVDYVYDYKIYQGEDFAEQVFHKFSKGQKHLPL